MKTRPLPPIKGRRKLVEWLNSLRNDVAAIWPMPSHNVRVNRTTRGTSFIGVAAPAEPGEPGIGKRFQIQQLGGDSLVCREWDGTTLGTTNISIAKQPHMRRTGFHGATVGGITYTYAANNNSRSLVHTNLVPATSSSTEEATPPYVVGEDIWAIEPEGGTGVSSVDWLETNSRAWLAPFRVVEVCVNGQPRKMVIRAGAPFV